MAHHEQAARSPLLQPTAWVTITAVGMLLLLAGCGGAPRTESRPAHSPTESSCAARPAWPDRTPISDMQFVGGVGWAVGAAGLLTSTDGGEHWVRLGTDGDDLVRVDFVDPDHGWVVGSSQLLATADGGDHWTRLPDPRCSRIRMVHFVTATRGFAVAGGAAAVLPDDLPTSRGVLLSTSDGGRSWRRLQAPADVQSVCFQDTLTGWIGTPHGIYATADSGHRWQQIVSAPGGAEQARPLVDVGCAGGGTAWALASGMGGASSQSPHLGWRLTTRDATALFAEQYFPHPAVAVTHQAPGSYPGPFSQIDANATAFFDNCPACGAGQVPWLIVTGTGSLVRHGHVRGLSDSTAAGFVSPSTGCVAGRFRRLEHNRITQTVARIVCTSDSGRHWRVAWQHRLIRRWSGVGG